MPGAALLAHPAVTGAVVAAQGAPAFANRAFIIQMILILGIMGITAWLFLKRGAKQLAIRRLLIIMFALFAVFTVIFPTILTQVAQLVGVGRGADLLLYATVVVLLGFLALQEARTKNAEKRTTYLARRLAIADAPTPEEFRKRAFGKGH
ncbi:DUF2304 domain-containing protein [Helcobacillus massiliensis]|uniref:DUF2304 domain-containing protein n=1 Tax=Helcobacillus massiliensis TaxID=521392 RepID=A0A839QNB9_9MICO|nr:DUF2304 domain-containing protein [Helcobacillus massiliensis]MBB3021963.1 hypothetical protein [Helcobacillus massiliensis]